ncbi:DUF1631 family protein [Arhodomonas aquaeolei]|uniref:DUF1631 family protein n=1 Tax=Arhodomonas aquaeolei TaxID=2369 RepID=UPI00037095CA|nr:DUF1631 family protein [Arhodomonas aquaeolei]
MNADDKVVYLRDGHRQRVSEVVQDLRHLATERLVRTATRTLDRSDDVLFERAERATEAETQEAYFQAMRELRLQRRLVVAHFRETLEWLFTGLARHRPTPLRPRAGAGAADGEDLALMDDRRLEEEVAIESATTRLRGRHGVFVGSVDARLRDLLDIDDLPSDASPFHPHTVVLAFSLAMQDVDIALNPRLILYKLFERTLDLELPRVLKAVDAKLEAAGARADKRDRAEQPEDETPEETRDAAEPAQPTPPDAGDDDADDDRGVAELLYRLMRRMKHQVRPAVVPGGGGAPGGPGGGSGSGGGPAAGPGGSGAGGVTGGGIADRRVVLRALSALQQEVLGSEETDPERIKARVNHWLDEHGHATALDASVDDVIDLVSMLFDNLLADPRLAPSLRVVIARLQIPVLRVALRDRKLFSQPEHPARRLINELAGAATGWTEPQDLDTDPLYCKVVEVVERVVTRYQDDVRVFDVALRDIRYFVEREQERARVIEQRTRQTAEGNLRVEIAREAVQSAVEERLGQQRVPAVVVRLLEEAWFRVLFITAVREGRESETWRRQLTVMDELLWSVRPKRDADERQRMLQLMPRLLQDLREGLNGIMYNPHEMTQLFRDLESVHLRCLTPGEDPAGDEGADEPAPSRSAEAPAAAAGWGQRPPDAEDMARVESLAVGSWFELRDHDPVVRAKLSARLDEGRRYVFVNRAGFRVAEYAAAEMARAVRDADVVELEEVAAFDQALERVIASLREIYAE